jgi:hypothetical protein
VFLLKDEIACDSDDAIVIAKAQELKSMLVSLNGDFADIVVYPPSRYLGIIALQVKTSVVTPKPANDGHLKTGQRR